MLTSEQSQPARAARAQMSGHVAIPDLPEGLLRDFHQAPDRGGAAKARAA